MPARPGSGKNVVKGPGVFGTLLGTSPHSLVGVAILASLTLGAAGGVEAQDGGSQVSSAERQTAQTAEEAFLPDVSPGGAFLRSLAIPGWGHAATGSYTRAGFYFATSGATFWMLTKSLQSLDAADDHLFLVESELERELERVGVTNPDSVAARLDADERVTEMRSLVDSREQQVEDWTAFGIFWLLLNATDAFVSAHLADFPEPVEVDVVPGTPGRPSELRFSIPVGGPGR